MMLSRGAKLNSSVNAPETLQAKRKCSAESNASLRPRPANSRGFVFRRLIGGRRSKRFPRRWNRIIPLFIIPLFIFGYMTSALGLSSIVESKSFRLIFQYTIVPHRQGYFTDRAPSSKRAPRYRDGIGTHSFYLPKIL